MHVDILVIYQPFKVGVEPQVALRLLLLLLLLLQLLQLLLLLPSFWLGRGRVTPSRRLLGKGWSAVVSHTSTAGTHTPPAGAPPTRVGVQKCSDSENTIGIKKVTVGKFVNSYIGAPRTSHLWQLSRSRPILQPESVFCVSCGDDGQPTASSSQYRRDQQPIPGDEPAVSAVASKAGHD